MVFGHNLCYMAPFDFPRAGFCMVFRRASFVFSCPGADFGGRGSDFGFPRSTFWPGDLFGPKKWSRRKLFCGGMILWWGFRGIHPAQMNSMFPRTHVGRLLCPKSPLKIISRQIPPNPENWCRLLAHPCGLPYAYV